MLVTSLIVLNTIMLLGMIAFLYIFKRSIPILLQGALNDVGAQLSKMFAEPQVSRAMSVLGKQSGEVRADKALQKRVASKAMDQIPGIGLILKQFDLTPIEGLKLMNDPLLGPLIQRGIAAAQKGLSGIGGGGQGFGGGSTQVSYGREE